MAHVLCQGERSGRQATAFRSSCENGEKEAAKELLSQIEGSQKCDATASTHEKE